MNNIEIDRLTPLAESIAKARRKKRYAAERRFRLYGIISISVAVAALCILLLSMLIKGLPAFYQTQLTLTVELNKEDFSDNGKIDATAIEEANYAVFLRRALRTAVPSAQSRLDKRSLYRLLSNGAAFNLQQRVMADPSLVGKTLTLDAIASDDLDQYIKGHIGSGTGGRLSKKQGIWIEKLQKEGVIKSSLSTDFFVAGDSREPELAGIWGALAGALRTMFITLLLSFPLGVAAAMYLEEFAKKNRWTDLIEVNINNLAAVPSIVFGLLGLAVFLSFFGLPRSAPLVGGIVLALMTLPTVIIASRAALGSVPPSIREAAFGMGASPMQVVLHHVFPLAFPGILTGTIIGAARALGETAPLLMIGMVAFIVDIPSSITDPATVLPVQIFLWADSPEKAFVERTAAATLILLAFLISMNLAAVILRKRFERRW